MLDAVNLLFHVGATGFCLCFEILSRGKVKGSTPWCMMLWAYSLLVPQTAVRVSDALTMGPTEGPYTTQSRKTPRHILPDKDSPSMTPKRITVRPAKPDYSKGEGKTNLCPVILTKMHGFLMYFYLIILFCILSNIWHRSFSYYTFLYCVQQDENLEIIGLSFLILMYCRWAFLINSGITFKYLMPYISNSAAMHLIYTYMYINTDSNFLCKSFRKYFCIHILYCFVFAK